MSNTHKATLVETAPVCMAQLQNLCFGEDLAHLSMSLNVSLTVLRLGGCCGLPAAGQFLECPDSNRGLWPGEEGAKDSGISRLSTSGGRQGSGPTALARLWLSIRSALCQTPGDTRPWSLNGKNEEEDLRAVCCYGADAVSQSLPVCDLESLRTAAHAPCLTPGPYSLGSPALLPAAPLLFALL